MLKVKSRINDDRILGLLTILTPLEPLKRHQDVKSLRTENTGIWLLSLESFCEWRDSNAIGDNSRVFYCYGIPGAGKTVICSTVIDNLYSQFHQHPNIGIACLYADCKDQTNQTLDHILGSFLRQLLTTATEPIADEIIQKLQDIQRRGRKLGAADSIALLKIRLCQLKHAFICIDAVDELKPKVRQHLLTILKEFGASTRVFLTGQDIDAVDELEPEARRHLLTILRELGTSTRLFPTGRESEIQNRLQVTQGYKVLISASQHDIEVFVREKIITDDPYPEVMDQVLIEDIVDAIIKKSQGMFLLPTLHVKMILGMPTNSQRREALKVLPTDLYASFQGVITRIRKCPNASQAELGMRVLIWLHFAYRPLRLVELQHALAVKQSHTEFDAGNIPSRKELLDCCLGLVVVNEETSTVRFMHYMLEEYFHDNARTEFPNGYSSLAENCLTYLNFGKLGLHCTDLGILQENMTKYAFLSYAALYWGTYYVKQQCSSNDLMKLAKMIVQHEDEPPSCVIQALYFEIMRTQYEGRIIAQKFSGIHAVAYFGLSDHTAYFCTVGLKDDSDRTPLSWAAGNGHEAIVQLLVERDGIDINARDIEGKSPLIWAAYGGHEAAVRLLVERDDIDINAKDKSGSSPLIWAAKYGHEAVVQLLIERDGIDINAKDEDRKSPLMWAVCIKHEAVVRLLVERDGIDINTKGEDGNSPLLWAARFGNEAIVQLLIERDGIDINAKGDGGKSPLIWAAKYGYEAVVQLLVERDGIDINAKDEDGRSSLIWAAYKGHETVVRLLVERDGIDINAKDEDGNSPLIWAALHGHEAVVRLLIERDGIDIHVKDEFGDSPLVSAAFKGHEAVVQLLIERDDIDINAKDNSGDSPLMWAAYQGHEAVVRLLIERDDIDINDKDGEGRSPLMCAAYEGHEAVVRLLIERDGTDIHAKNEDGETAMSLATQKGHEAVVRLLSSRCDKPVSDSDIVLAGSLVEDVTGVRA